MRSNSLRFVLALVAAVIAGVTAFLLMPKPLPELTHAGIHGGSPRFGHSAQNRDRGLQEIHSWKELSDARRNSAPTLTG